MRVNPEQIENLKVDDDSNFEILLNESEKSFENGKIQEGIIVKINQDYAMVSVCGAKQEGRLPIAEIMDDRGNLLFNEGDKIEIFVSLGSERLHISHKRVLKFKKLEEKIEEIKDCYEDLVVTCKVIKKNKGGYIVEFDEIEAFLPKRESALKDEVKNIGKVFKANIISVDTKEKTIIVSRKKFLNMMEKNREEIIQKLLNEDKIYQGIVSKITSFGMLVEVEGVEGLVHYTEISHRGPINPASVAKVGDSVQVKILEFDAVKKRVSYSIKATIDDSWGEVKDKLEVGDAIRVCVSKIESYGAFVDLGNGTEGFLHISEISWDKRPKHPSEILKEKQEIDVEIIEIDSDRRRLRVSLKKMMPRPFVQFYSRVKVGDVIEGKVVKIVDFGAFVNLGEIDGLLHNEDISWDRDKKSSLKIGDVIQVKVVKIDKENERISLSLKALEESPVDRFAKKHSLDSIVQGKVVDIKDFGVFVALDDGVEALVRNEDLHPLKKEEIRNGDVLEGAIVHIDGQSSKIRISIKKLERLKEREQLSRYNDSNLKMTLGDILKQHK